MSVRPNMHSDAHSAGLLGDNMQLQQFTEGN
jgi:hypothetical protein